MCACVCVCAGLQIVISLSFLCDEFAFLVKTAETKFYPPLTLFGQFPNKVDEDEFEAGELEEIMGRSLSMFQELMHFTDRCNAVVLNAVHQLASLYDSHTQLYPVFKDVKLIPFYKVGGAVCVWLCVFGCAGTRLCVVDPPWRRRAWAAC